MVIKVRCRCGKGIKVRDSAAGKRVRCPECSKPVKIPEPVIEEFDDYGDDAYEDDPYDQPAAPPPRRRKPAASGKRPSKAKKKSAGGGSRLPLLIGGGIAVVILLIGGALYAIFSGGDSPDAPAVAANNPGQSPPTTTPTQPPATEPPPSTQADEQPPAASATANAVAETNQNSAPPAADPPMTTPQTTAASGNQLWVVLSDFKEVANPQAIGKAHQVNYRVAAGAPETGKAYVLYMGSSMGMMERFYEVPVEIQASGTVQIPPAIGMAGDLRAYLALKKGRREWKPVSGEIAIGGQPTSPKRPPTIVEAAGAAAQGKALALANGRLEKARSRMAVVVDYVLQKKADMGQRYFLVVSGGGDNIEADVTMDLSRATVGKKGQFGLAVMPGRSFPAGDLKVHVETRKSRIRREPGTVASNTVSVQR